MGHYLKFLDLPERWRPWVTRHLPVSALLLACWVFVAHASPARAADWREYRDPELGFRVVFPRHLAQSRLREGRGLEFSTRDGEFLVTVEGGKSAGGALERRWRDSLDKLGRGVTYKARGKTWFVVSGVDPRGIEYYCKFFERAGRWTGLVITYPHAKNHTYDPWVTTIEKNFSPFQN
ncbi:MAG: hypothetical protein ACR2OZ_20185 [Verrucomicrobiales bacterium]